MKIHFIDNKNDRVILKESALVPYLIEMLKLIMESSGSVTSEGQAYQIKDITYDISGDILTIELLPK